MIDSPYVFSSDFAGASARAALLQGHLFFAKKAALLLSAAVVCSSCPAAAETSCSFSLMAAPCALFSSPCCRSTAAVTGFMLLPVVPLVCVPAGLPVAAAAAAATLLYLVAARGAGLLRCCWPRTALPTAAAGVRLLLRCPSELLLVTMVAVVLCVTPATAAIAAADTYEWHVVEGVGTPSGRSSMVAQVYNNSLYIFGGYNGHNVLNDFYEFKFSVVSIPPSSFLADLRRLLHPPDADVAFVVDGGRQLHACRAILGARSEHFRALFHSGLKETEMVEQGIPIKIEGVQYEVMAALLEYLHTDAVTERLTCQQTVQLMVAAERFCVDRLKCLCVETLRRALTIDTVMDVLVAAYTHHILDLQEICLDYLLEHEEEMKEKEAMRPLINHPALLYEVYMRSSSRSITSSSGIHNSSNNSSVSRTQGLFPLLGAAVAGGAVAAGAAAAPAEPSTASNPFWCGWTRLAGRRNRGIVAGAAAAAGATAAGGSSNGVGCHSSSSSHSCSRCAAAAGLSGGVYGRG